MRRTIRRIGWAALVGALLSTLVAGPAMASATSGLVGSQLAGSAASGDLLSDTGAKAIDDLRECLASRDQLDVYYLIDASGSLFEGSPEHTDPSFVRAGLIANSLRELGSLGADVSYALGFFGERFKDSIAWRAASSDLDAETKRIEATIKQQDSLGWTNWEAGIAGAQRQLAAQHAKTDGCQLLIWLTDGGINVNDSNDALDNAAINNLCGEKIAGGSNPNHGHGAFNELRQSGAVVIGVLLNVTNDAKPREAKYREYMQPLVEGTGTAGGAAVTCGEQPMPEGYVNGAFVQATSAADLALVFLKLGATVGGGSLSGFDGDGGFLVDEGVSQFSVITRVTDWAFERPDGSMLTATSPEDAVVTTSGGALRVTVTPRSGDVGRWVWQSPDPALDDLYYFSGLAIEIDEPTTFLVGAENALSGRVLRTDGRDTPLSVYSYTPELAVVTASGSTPVQSDRIELDPETGEFTFYFAANEASGVATLEARVDRLATLPSRLPLAAVAAQLAVTVTVPDQYPTLSPSRLVLSDLVGADGLASGAWTVSAPADGTAGSVCFPEGLIPVVESDSGERDDTWTWQVSADDEDECLEVPAGSTSEIVVEASNPIAAYSTVTAALPVEYRSESGDSIEGRLPIEFASTRPINAAVFGVTTLLLILAGLLVPLIIMWLVSFLTYKISRQGNIYRMRMPVQVTKQGEVLTETNEPLRSMQFGTDEFKFQPKAADTRSVVDADLGRLQARVPVFPLRRSWYELLPAGGRYVVGSTGYLPRREQDAGDEGRIAGFNGDLGAVWALVFNRDRLRGSGSSDTIPATLVVYVRNSDSSSSVFHERMTQLLVPASLKPRLDRVRKAAAEASEPSKPAGSPPPPSTPKVDPIDDRPPGLSRPGSRPDQDPPGHGGTRRPDAGGGRPPAGRSGSTPTPSSRPTRPDDDFPRPPGR